MGSAQISTTFLLKSLLAVAVLEAAAAVLAAVVPLPRLWLMAATRTVQLAAVSILVHRQTGGWRVLGLDRSTVASGIRCGLIWSAGFAAVAGLSLGEYTALWSPDAPNLYDAITTILKDGQAIDSCETTFGIREFRFD